MLERAPALAELRSLLGNAYDTWQELYDYISDHYIMDILWDEGGKYGHYECKFRKSGRTLCTLYVKDNELTCLLIFGKKEREQVAAIKASFPSELQAVYDNSKTYHDGKWMYIGLQDSRLLDYITKMLTIKKKPNRNMAMCGYCCDLCQALTRNIKKKDDRQQLSLLWAKYYDLQIPPEKIVCDGCRSKKRDAKRVDGNCPVRKCVLERQVNSCGDCADYPCEIFAEREGLSSADAKQKLGSSYNNQEYEDYLLAYDNRSRLDRYKARQARS